MLIFFHYRMVSEGWQWMEKVYAIYGAVKAIYGTCVCFKPMESQLASLLPSLLFYPGHPEPAVTGPSKAGLSVSGTLT